MKKIYNFDTDGWNWVKSRFDYLASFKLQLVASSNLAFSVPDTVRAHRSDLGRLDLQVLDGVQQVKPVLQLGFGLALERGNQGLVCLNL